MADQVQATSALRRIWAQDRTLLLILVLLLALSLVCYVMAHTHAITPFFVMSDRVDSMDDEIRQLISSEKSASEMTPAGRRALRRLLVEHLQAFETRSFARTLLEHLSLTLFVTFLLIITIELHTRRKAREEISREVLEAVFQKIVPDEVFKEIRDYVLMARVIKRRYRFEMRMWKEDEGAETYLIADVVHHFWVHNLTGRPNQKYPYRYGLADDPSLDRASGEHLPKFTRLLVGGKPVDLTKASAEGGRRIEYEVPLDADSKVGTEVQLEVREVGRFPKETGVWTLDTLVDSLTVFVDLPVAGLKYEVAPQHHRARHFQKVEQDLWTVDSVFLPGQGWQLSVDVTKAPPGAQGALQ